jgi:hypothetical protein
MTIDELREACLNNLRVYFEHPRHVGPRLILTFEPGDSPVKALGLRGKLLSGNQEEQSIYELDTLRVLVCLMQEHIRDSRAPENETKRETTAVSRTEEPVQ